MNPRASVIEFQNVWKEFPGAPFPTLAGLDLKIKEGSIHVLIGFSGTGKSVTIRHALGLMEPDKGDVLVMGQELSKMTPFQKREMRKNFGMLFQSVALFDSLNVYENIAFPIREHRPEMVESEISDRVDHLLKLVELKGAQEKMPEQLSGGMKKRVGLARAMALSPKILICDEPTTGLDPVTAQVIDQLIAITTKEHNATAFLVSHDIHAALRIADDVSMIFNGRIIETGDPELFKRSGDETVRNFLQCAGVE